MKTKVYVIVFLVMCFTHAKAQKNNLIGDTIFVNTDEELQVKFPSDKLESRWTSINPPYVVTYSPNSIFLHAKADTAHCSTLSVFEGPGPRNHSFIVCYQKNISKVIYDYSTLKKLQQRIKEVEARRDVKNAAGNEISGNVAGMTKLLEEGDKEQENGLFDQAQLKYEKVLQAQPANAYALKQLSNVKAKKDNVVQLKSEANKALIDKQYAQALTGYNKVLELSPNDLFAQTQIEKIKLEKRLASDKIEQQRIDSTTENLKAIAEKAYNEQRYDDAIAAYDQCIKLNPVDNISKSKKEAIEKIKSQVSEANKTFITLVGTADKALDNREYEVAQASYLSASKLKPNDESILAKLQLTNEKIQNKRKADEYEAAMSAGDKALKNQDFERAKAEYAKAGQMFKDSTSPGIKMTEVDKAIENQKRLIDIDNKYGAAIEKGDKAVSEKDYSAAKISYALASSLKPGDLYAKNKLAEIDAVVENISKSAEVGKNYDSAMSRGNVAYNKKDYSAAKTAFTQAADLKPDEQEPKNKLQQIDDKLNPGVSSTKYDSAMAKGNSALLQDHLVLALSYFKEALRIRPSEATAVGRIKYVQGLITSDSLQQVENQARAERLAREEIRKKRFNEGMQEYDMYVKAATVADYESQLVYLKNFLNIFPDASELNEYQYTQKIDEAKKKISQIRDYLTRTKGKWYQSEAIPYVDLELEKKYGSINFNALPDGQKIDSVDSAIYSAYSNIGREMLAEKPKFSLTANSNTIKITCVGISVRQKEAFYKIMIVNSDTAEFLTGSMQVSLVKKTVDTIKINPNYISAFPIVQPGKEFYIIYAAKDIAVGNDDVLLFELNDRLRNNSFKIAIPGSAYNAQKPAM